MHQTVAWHLLFARLRRLGQQMYQTFVTDKRLERSKPISDPIKKNKHLPCSRPPAREQSKSSLQVSSLKSAFLSSQDCTLPVRHKMETLATFSVTRTKHVPPQYLGLKFRLRTKSDVQRCLEICIDLTSDVPDTNVIILDGAVVNFLKPLAQNL